jgi:hypothetical protein
MGRLVFAGNMVVVLRSLDCENWLFSCVAIRRTVSPARGSVNEDFTCEMYTCRRDDANRILEYTPETEPRNM